MPSQNVVTDKPRREDRQHDEIVPSDKIPSAENTERHLAESQDNPKLKV